MRPALVALLIANAVPLAGVLFLQWDVFELFALYWSESVVIGGCTVLRLVGHAPADRRWRPRDAVSGLFLAAMFCLHYGLFLFAHAIVIGHLFGRGGGPSHDLEACTALLRTAATSSGGLGLWALVASHGIAFVADGPPWRRAAETVGRTMTRPYGRVVAMHGTLLAGGMLARTGGAGSWLLAILVLAKVAVDVAVQARTHRRAAAAADPPAPAPASGP